METLYLENKNKKLSEKIISLNEQINNMKLLHNAKKIKKESKKSKTNTICIYKNKDGKKGHYYGICVNEGEYNMYMKYGNKFMNNMKIIREYRSINSYLAVKFIKYILHHAKEDEDIEIYHLNIDYIIPIVEMIKGLIDGFVQLGDEISTNFAGGSMYSKQMEKLFPLYTITPLYEYCGRTKPSFDKYLGNGTENIDKFLSKVADYKKFNPRNDSGKLYVDYIVEYVQDEDKLPSQNDKIVGDFIKYHRLKYNKNRQPEDDKTVLESIPLWSWDLE